MLLLKPVTIDTIAMTVATPTTIPRMVSPARSLWARTARNAKRTFSPKPRRKAPAGAATRLLVPKGFDRIEARGLHGGIEAEEDPDRERDEKSDDHRPRGRLRRQSIECPLDEGGDRDSEDHPDRTAQDRQRRGLRQKLEDDVAPESSDGLPDPDLARSLGDGDWHDVHDADTADQQGDERDEDHCESDSARDPLETLDHLVRSEDREIVRLVEGHVPARAKHGPPLLRNDRNLVGTVRDRRDVNGVAAARLDEGKLVIEGGERNEHEVVVRPPEHLGLDLADAPDDAL